MIKLISNCFFGVVITVGTKPKILMAGKAPSWSDQWGSGNYGVEDNDDKTKKNSNAGGSSKKMAEVKAVASAGLGKAKAAAVVGADKAKVAAVFGAKKVKSGTSIGIKWIKNQYQKRSSK